jgi:CheY-like chemotaxis protein
MTRRILVIDDEERIREVVRACLEDLGGWKALTASSADEALSTARDEPLDAILLDLSMPDTDGFQLYEQLHQDESLHHIPVILLTAKVLESEGDRLAKMGVAGVITKPFNPIFLCGDVAALLGWSAEK